MNPSTLSSLAPKPRGAGVAYVTGAGGFIGRHAASAFRDAGWTVEGMGSSDSPVSQRGLAEAAANVGGPDIVIHCAGAGSVGPSLTDPEGDYARNVGSLAPVIAFLQKDAPKARLVFLSSAAVYGAGHAGPIREDAALSPISPYGRHKRQAEELALASGLDAVCLRLFSVYGPGLRKQLMWDVATRLAAGADPLRLSGTGGELRDYLHVDDAVRLIGCAVATEAPPSIVNGGAGVPTPVAEVAALLCAVAGDGVQPVFDGKVRAGDPPSLVADIALARTLGFAPQISLAEGVAGFYRWARAAA